MTTPTPSLQERADLKDSRQPRYRNPQEFFQRMYMLTSKVDLELPPYSNDTRQRDLALAQFIHNEPYLAGVLNSAVQIDINRRWTLTGAKSQVNRYAKRMSEFENGIGWRALLQKLSHSFYASDLGYVGEIIKVGGENGALDSIVSVDPTRCLLTGDLRRPLKYFPKYGNSFLEAQEWKADWFIQDNALPSYLEEMKGVGYCAVSRCIELAKIMVGVYSFYQEKLDSAPPLGYAFTTFTKEQFNEAVMDAIIDQENQGNRYFKDALMLYGATPETILQFVGFAETPENFDLEIFTELLMKGYALQFGYSVDEFYTVRAGTFGRGRETDMQMKQASTKGELEFANSFETRFQKELPNSILFKFEERDDEYSKVKAETDKLIAETISEVYQLKLGVEGEPLLDKTRAMELGVRLGLFPANWTNQIEDAQVNSEKPIDTVQEDALDSEEIRIAIKEFPHEPIVQYNSFGRFRTIFKSGYDAIPKYYPILYPENRIINSKFQSLVFGLYNEEISKEVFVEELEREISLDLRTLYNASKEPFVDDFDELTPTWLEDEIRTNQKICSPLSINIERDRTIGKSPKTIVNEYNSLWDNMRQSVGVKSRIFAEIKLETEYAD